MSDYGFVKELQGSVESVEKQVRAALESEKFGVLFSADLSEKFRGMLGIESPRYLMLGACSPAHAYKAIEAEPNIGLLLPCNIVIYEKKNGAVGLAVIKPSVAMGMVENDALEPVAREVEELLVRVFNSVV